ncbi:MAG: hypothetical protein FWD45_00275 [Coriobacteriia bacterium]|nr:hypothetical protein [Coriobacteriia bacterium]
MAYSGDLLKINNQTVPGLVEYTVQRSKLWKDADRNMEGEVRASLIGIFLKLKLVFRMMSQTEVAALTQLLDTAVFNVTFFDARTQTTYTAEYYASDYDASLFSKPRGLYEQVKVNLVPIRKRVY